MQSGTRQAEPRLTRWEVLGAWLHVWTPAKDAEVPPVPWRKLVLWGALAALVIGGALAIAIPQIDEGKKLGAAERARLAARAAALEHARLAADQRVHALKVGSSSEPVLVVKLEMAITRDAKQREKAGTITGPVLTTKCTAASANVIQFPGSRVYKCFVAINAGFRGEGKDVLGTGYAFIATIYPDSQKVAWCKQNPHPDEKGYRGFQRVRMSPICAGKLSAVL